jgi:hypothetical protein
VALDVSDKALAIGRSIFARDPRTRWDLRPAFTVYDGRTLPLADGTIDRIVLYDAYHHLPNPRRLLQEFRRVLTGDGIVAMSEPGRGHAASDSSRAESAGGVLENELALEDIAEQALAAGFTAARVVVAPRRPPVEVDVRDLRRFMGGRGFARYWKSLCAELDGHHYLLLTAGDPAVTTRRPKYLNAVITSDETRSGLDLESLSARRVTFDVYNAGDTVWLNGEGEPGWTRFGAHLYKAGASRERVDYDWLRAPLASSVRPEESIRVAVDLPAIPTPGDYEIVFDLVVEGMAWFGERGSVPLAIQATVR